MKALLFLFAFSVFLIPIASAQTIQSEFNGGFEDITPESASYGGTAFSFCTNQFKLIDRPVGWNFTSFNGTHENTADVLDNAKIVTDQVTQGSFALSLWRVPPYRCEVDLISPTTTGNLSNAILVSAQSDFVSLDTARYNLEFDVSKQDAYVEKCTGGLLECGITKEHYGVTCPGFGSTDEDETALQETSCLIENIAPNPILGGLKMEIFYNSTGNPGIISSTLVSTNDFSPLENLPSQSQFKSFSVDLRQLLPFDVDMVSVKFSVKQTDSSSTIPAGFVIDDIKFVNNELPESPATDYISDMTTFSDFPTDNFTAGCAGSCTGYSTNDPETSIRFDGVALVNVSGTLALTFVPDQVPVVTSPEVLINYNDGRVVNVMNASAVVAVGDIVAPRFVTFHFPIYDFDNIDNITGTVDIDYLSGGGGDVTPSFTLDFDPLLSTVRQTFNPATITTVRETITGESSLAPVIVYENEILSNGTHLYKLFDFGFVGESVDLSFELRGSDNALKDIDTETVSSNAFNTASFSNDWITDQTLLEDDIVIIRYITSIEFPDTATGDINFASNSSTQFNVGVATGGVTSCTEQCDPAGTGNRLIPFSESDFGGNSTVCSFTVIENDPVCVAEIGLDPEAEEQDPNDPILGITGLLTGTGFEFLGFLLTPVALVFFIFLGLGVWLETKVKTTNGIIFLITFISGLAMGAFFGVFDLGITIVLVLISTGFLIYQVKQMTGIGNGGA